MVLEGSDKNINSIRGIVENFKSRWEFEKLELFYIENMNIDLNIKMEYLLFLYNVGLFSKIDRLMQIESDVQPFWWFGCNYFEIRDEIISALNSGVSNSTRSAYHRLNCSIDNLTLNKEDAKEYINQYLVKEHSVMAIGYLLKRMIDYFEVQKEYSFFGENYNIIVPLIEKCSDSFLRKNHYIDKFFTLSGQNLFDRFYKKKVAVLFSGQLRGDWEANLKDIISEIVHPLEADCFVFTWNKIADWPGLGGSPTWSKRFLRRIVNPVPEIIRTKNSLQKKCPAVYKKLSKACLSKLDILKFNKFSCVKSVVAHDEKEFELNFGTTSSASKQYYALYQVYQEMMQYEKNNNIRYDIVIRIRPDIKLSAKGVIKNIVDNLKINEVITGGFGKIGSDDSFLIGCRNSIKNLFLLWENAKNNYVPYINFPNFDDTHGNIMKLFLLEGIKLSNSSLSYSKKTITLEDTPCLRGIMFPDIKQELETDLTNLKKNGCTLDAVRAIGDYFSEVSSVYPYYGAVDRVRGHLSFKIGKEIKGCSFFSIVMLIPRIMVLKKEHIKYLFELKSLNLPPLRHYKDYKEALKEKECLTYKLGEAFIKASKIWYKGGYVKLWFEVRRLRKRYGLDRKISFTINNKGK